MVKEKDQKELAFSLIYYKICMCYAPLRQNKKQMHLLCLGATDQALRGNARRLIVVI